MGNNLIYMRRRLGIMSQPHRETQTGDLVTFTGVKAPLSVLAQIVPVQSGSGDPSPENVRNITGWTGCEIPRTGKNLFDENGEYQYKKFIADNGATRIASSAPYPKLYSQKIPVVPGKSYSMSGKSQTNGYLRVCQYDSNNTFIKRSISSSTTNPTLTITTESNASYVIINPDENISDLQFEVGSVSAFSAYSGTTLSVNWTDIAGTVYGGSLKVNTDGTGVLTETHVIVDMGDLSWSYASSYQYFTASIDGIATSEAGETQSIVCEIYKTTASKTASGWSTAENCTIGQRGGYANIVVKDTAYTDKTVFTNAVDGYNVVYPLATPVTYNLTSQQVGRLMALNGVNNIWANTGEISVEYWKN